jgi:hypothetical protein
MKLRVACVVLGFLSLVLSLAAQSSSPTVAQVPPLIQFSNVATDGNGKPLTGVIGITFSLYQEQQGGSPLWLETQQAEVRETRETLRKVKAQVVAAQPTLVAAK